MKNENQKISDLYNSLTKKQMFEIVYSFATLLKEDRQHWTTKVKKEIKVLKANKII